MKIKYLNLSKEQYNELSDREKIYAKQEYDRWSKKNKIIGYYKIAGEGDHRIEPESKIETNTIPYSEMTKNQRKRYRKNRTLYVTREG